MHVSERPALDGPGGSDGGELQKHAAVIGLSSKDSSVAVKGNLGLIICSSELFTV